MDRLVFFSRLIRIFCIGILTSCLIVMMSQAFALAGKSGGNQQTDSGKISQSDIPLQSGKKNKGGQSKQKDTGEQKTGKDATSHDTTSNSGSNKKEEAGNRGKKSGDNPKTTSVKSSQSQDDTLSNNSSSKGGRSSANKSGKKATSVSSSSQTSASSTKGKGFAGGQGKSSNGRNETSSNSVSASTTSKGGTSGGEGRSSGGKKQSESGSRSSGQYGGAGGSGENGTDITLTVDDDSDRPDWAQGNKEENPHRGEGNPNPGDMKGDEYGDLYVLVREEVTGVPILFEGELELCTNLDCTETAYTVNGEVPPGVTPIEVEFERLNLGRAPDKVIEHALNEAMSKITAEDAVLSLDYARRIMVDGVTIDSPLENLALYIALMNEDDDVIGALSSLGEPLDLAAALLGGAASKTADITVDILYYSNQIYDIVEQPDTYYDYSMFDYSRSVYDEDVNYFYMDGEDLRSATVNLAAYLDETHPNNAADGSITLFSIAADDALEIVELLHTQIHDEKLPGTVVTP